MFCPLICLIRVLHFIARGTKATSGRLPPGPKSLPVIGNLLVLGDKPHKSLAKLSRTYGPLMSLKLGQLNTVVISSATLAKKILQKHDAHGHHEAGMPWLPVAEPWRNLRKICNSYVFSNQRLDANQQLRLEKIQDLFDDIQESCRLGRSVNIGELAFKTTLNAMSNTIFSLDLTNSSLETAKEFKEVVRCIMDEAGKPNLADYFPFLKNFDLQRIRSMGKYFGKMLEVFDRKIYERLELRKAKDYVQANDMLETLLSICEDSSEEFDTHRIKHLFLDLFVAGTDTTSSTMEWAMSELLRNPKTLSEARQELEQTIGKSSWLQESDVARLPYLQAIVKETFRLHPAVPLLLPRKAGADVEMFGFTVPKGAQVLVNAWAIGRDPNMWENPDSFMPERFLGSDVDVRGRHFELIPFGAGRRICPGLPLAIRMLHMMLGTLIHSFDWRLEDGVTPESLDMDDRFGITLEKAQPLRAIPIKL
ncbi:hypothetical protein K2173_018196 [Erythroxylum novogranatense]|uniref:Cytochrome P450 n=1 Tax=Erythroxylum novogranatense TaxID=1862640 RepID=A0AAV8TLK8_9ROSI|nr:hypothetical protein K2173_018196 [Erythroxylum novogranatense]